MLRSKPGLAVTRKSLSVSPWVRFFFLPTQTIKEVFYTLSGKENLRLLERAVESRVGLEFLPRGLISQVIRIHVKLQKVVPRIIVIYMVEKKKLSANNMLAESFFFSLLLAQFLFCCLREIIT